MRAASEIINVLGTAGVPAWVQPGALFDLDFYNSRYWPRQASVELADVRASVAYAADRSGAWNSVANDVTRITNAGMTNEPARTDILLWSQDFSNAAWIKADTTATAAATTAPDGTLTATLLTEGVAGTASTQQGASASVSAAAIEGEIFLKPSAVNSWLQLIFGDSGATNGANVWVNISTGALGTVSNRGTGTNSSATIEPAANGFFRVKCLTTLPSGATAGVFFMRSATANNSTTRVNNAAYFAWQADFKIGATITTPIKTTTVATARATDAITVQRLDVDHIVFTFDDDSQQTVSSIDPSVKYTLPTNLNRYVIKRMTGYALAAVLLLNGAGNYITRADGTFLTRSS